MRASSGLVAALLWFGTELGGASAPAQSSRSAPTDPPAGVLAVPYLAQSPLLCGGAALAMVERWWGRRGVYSEDFAALVRKASRGILTTDLTRAAKRRGWDTHAVRGTIELIRESLRDSTPVIALIEVARDEYHYVVLLGWSEGRVVFHDPANAPFTSLPENRFLAKWSGADRWALILRPRPASSIATATVPEGYTVGAAEPLPCPPYLDRALDAVAARRLSDADSLLAEAARACPAEPLVRRELAGVRFKQGRLAESIPLAEAYLALVPGDRYAWQLLATTRYLSGDPDGALTAWNRMDRPVVDLVRIDGMEGIRFQGIARAISVSNGAVLTPARLALARRRVAEVPALQQAAVEYQPAPGGIVEVRVAVIERPTIEPVWRLLAGGAIRAVSQHEASLDVASPTGAGELWSGSWRWVPARSRAAVRMDMPVHLGFQGVLGMEGGWDRSRISLDAAGLEVLEESRRFAAVGFGGWLTPGLRPSAALRLDRWTGNQTDLALSAGADLSGLRNRFQAASSGEFGSGFGNTASYWRGRGGASWTSAPGLGRPSWSARIGFEWVSPHTPLGLWPIAGGSVPWAIPLRAHSLTGAGPLPGRSVGRGILHGGVSGDHPVHRFGPVLLAVGGFVDAARVGSAADRSMPNRTFIDGGGGIRIGIAEGRLGVLRIDFARSLVGEPHSALSVGVHSNWPPFLPAASGTALRP